MALTGRETVLPFNAMAPEQRDSGLLVQVAETIPGEWVTVGVDRSLNGVQFVPWGCADLTTAELFCAADEDLVTPSTLPSVEAFGAFRITDALTCSTMSVNGAELGQRVTTRLNVMVSSALTAQLVGATSSSSPSLSSEATVVGSGSTSLGEGLAALEDHLADKLNGAVGIIHLTPGLLLLAAGGGYVRWRDGQWRTPAGHLVVADAGFTGAVAPTGGAAATSDQEWIYASGKVWYTVSDPKILADYNHQSLDMTRNQWEIIGDAFGLVVFDPCAVGAVRVTKYGDGSTSTGTQFATNMGQIEGATVVTGWALYNSHATDAALIYLRNGDEGTDPMVVPIALAAGETAHFSSATGFPFPDGVFVTAQAGGANVSGTIFTS